MAEQFPYVTIQITSVKTTELTELETGKKFLSKKQYEATPLTTVKQHANGSVIEIKMELIVTMEQTGKRAEITTTTTFDIQTDYSFISHPTSQTTLQIFTELTNAAFGHTRMAFIIKSKGTIYEKALLPFNSFVEVMKTAEQAIKSMMN